MQIQSLNKLQSPHFKACIFDLDGVLVDTAIFHYQAWKRLANSLGFDFTTEQNEELKGISRVESLEKILNWGNVKKNEAEKLELATIKNKWYIDLISEMTANDILPGTVNFLTELSESGYKLAIGSASKNATLILEKTKIIHFFDTIIDGNLVSKSKPNPEVFLKGAAMLNVNPNECVVFEDAVAGVLAAKTAGMKTIGIGEQDILNQADFVVSGLDKLTIKELLKL